MDEFNNNLYCNKDGRCAVLDNGCRVYEMYPKYLPDYYEKPIIINGLWNAFLNVFIIIILLICCLRNNDASE